MDEDKCNDAGCPICEPTMCVAGCGRRLIGDEAKYCLVCVTLDRPPRDEADR